MIYDRLICNFVSIFYFSQVLYIILGWICPPRIIKLECRIVDLFIDPRYEWSITFLSQFLNFAKPVFDWLEKSAKLASNWLEKKACVVSYGRIYVTNIKIL